VEKRRVRIDLTESFKVTKGMYDVNENIFFKLDDSHRRKHDQNCLKRDLDLM